MTAEMDPETGLYSPEAVRQLDRRRQAQIQNQIASINRLLEGPATYDDEMAALHDELAKVQGKLTIALEDIESLRAQLAAAESPEA